MVVNDNGMTINNVNFGHPSANFVANLASIRPGGLVGVSAALDSHWPITWGA